MATKTIALDYLAGLIDGEGYVTIAKKKAPGGTINYSCSIKIGMTKAGVWNIYGLALDKLLPLIEERLVLKSKQVKLLRQLRLRQLNTKRIGKENGMGIYTYPKKEWSARTRLYNKVRKLNCRGDN